MSVALKDLLEAGAHFGHQTKRWNPKMKPYIYGARNGIHIIDLSKTLPLLTEALKFVKESVAQGSEVLFIGTKKQAQDIVREEATRCGMYYVSQRWLGGTLTNFKTIKASIDRLHSLQKKKEDGTFATLSKKENLEIDREIIKLEKALGGIKDMVKLPGVVVMIDPKKEHIALHESDVLKIPVVAIADTNCDPEDIDYLIPSNDDSIRVLRLILGKMADVILEGKEDFEMRARAEQQEAQANQRKGGAQEMKSKKGAAYVSKPESFEQEAVETFSASPEVKTEEENA